MATGIWPWSALDLPGPPATKAEIRSGHKRAKAQLGRTDDPRPLDDAYEAALADWTRLSSQPDFQPVTAPQPRKRAGKRTAVSASAPRSARRLPVSGGDEQPPSAWQPVERDDIAVSPQARAELDEIDARETREEGWREDPDDLDAQERERRHRFWAPAVPRAERGRTWKGTLLKWGLLYALLCALWFWLNATLAENRYPPSLLAFSALTILILIWFLAVLGNFYAWLRRRESYLVRTITFIVVFLGTGMIVHFLLWIAHRFWKL